MSLEQALAENTAVMKTLITVLQSAAHVSTPVAAPVAQSAAPVAAPKSPVAFGDPEGTRYFVVEAHNTVYSLKPGDVETNVAGAQQVDVDTYLAKKDAFAKKIKAAAPSVAPAAAAPVEPATTAAPAPSAAAPAATASAADPTFVDVVNKVKELHAISGNPGVSQVLTQYGVAKVPELNGKAPNATLIAATQALIDTAKSASALGL